MLEVFLSLLPPYNLARLFSAYRILEAENDELRDKVCQLEESLTDRVNYILLLRGAPGLDVVKKDKPPNETPMPMRKSLRETRKQRTAEAMAKIFRTPPGENGASATMAARADEYAATISDK
jgi:hypothetical protein